MYYLLASTYQFVTCDHMTHLRREDAATTLCGQVCRDDTSGSYTTCAGCMLIGTHLRVIRRGRFAYVVWRERWVADMRDEGEQFAVGPFGRLDDAQWYVRHGLYARIGVLPGDVPMLRLSRELGNIVALQLVRSAQMRLRPGGLQVTVELTDDVPSTVITMIIDNLDMAASRIGFGRLRLPVDHMAGTYAVPLHSITMLFPYPFNLSRTSRSYYAHYSLRGLHEEPPNDSSGHQSKEV